MASGANRLKGEVSVEVGEGKGKRTLLFLLGINEMITIQDEFSVDDWSEIAGRLQRGQDLKLIRSFVRAALSRHQPEITHEDAGDLIMELGAERIGEILLEVQAKAFPSDRAQEGKATSHSRGRASSSKQPAPA